MTDIERELIDLAVTEAPEIIDESDVRFDRMRSGTAQAWTVDGSVD